MARHEASWRHSSTLLSHSIPLSNARRLSSAAGRHFALHKIQDRDSNLPEQSQSTGVLIATWSASVVRQTFYMTDRLLAFGSFEEVDPVVDRWCFCVDSVRDGMRLGARGGKQILGTGTRPMAWPRSLRRVCLRLGRDQFDECANSLSEISSFSVPTA